MLLLYEFGNVVHSFLVQIGYEIVREWNVLQFFSAGGAARNSYSGNQETRHTGEKNERFLIPWNQTHTITSCYFHHHTQLFRYNLINLNNLKLRYLVTPIPATFNFILPCLVYVILLNKVEK